MKRKNPRKSSKRSAYKMMEDEGEMVELECKSEMFIESLYDVLRRGTENNCFLEGAFVISDQDSKVLNLLTNTCVKEDGSLANNFRSSFAGGITHDVFMNKDSFKQVHRGSRLDIDYLIRNNIILPGVYYNSYNQYENEIRNPSHKVKELEFLCNPVCRETPNLPECIEARRKVKRIMLFYPFAVVKNAAYAENEEVKRYIYFKLEETPAISVGHAISSVGAYLSPVSRDDSGFDYRRERMTSNDAYRYKAVLRNKDQNFYYQLYNIDANSQDVRFYNDYVRSNDEFYIPQAMTDDILRRINV
jgi:ABC-type antimicrobial peptide transport system permease subunit